jgi:plastocyanin
VSAQRSFRVIALVAACALVFSSCGSDGPDEDAVAPSETVSETVATDHSATEVPVNGEEVEVLALDNNFRDEDIEIVAGTTVVWNNGGRNDHNIVPADNTDSWGVDVEDFAPGDVYSHAFTSPGEYAYYCTLHGTADFGMIGTVVVTG